MKSLSSIFSIILVCLWGTVLSSNALTASTTPARSAVSTVGWRSVAGPAQVNVTQFHNHDSRDGLYVDSAFTPDAAANLTRDLNFDGTIVGNVYAQPLYIEDGPGGRAMIIAVTELNNVYALDAVDGSIIWQRNVGAPVPNPSCTEVGSYGIIST